MGSGSPTRVQLKPDPDGAAHPREGIERYLRSGMVKGLDPSSPSGWRRHFGADGNAPLTWNRLTGSDPNAKRYLVDGALLGSLTERLGAELADPVKPTVVQNQRSMTTWVLRKKLL